MPKTLTELAKEEADRQAAALKKEQLKYRPPIHEPSGLRKKLTDKINESIPESTQTLKDSLKNLKNKSAESYHDWIASMMEIFNLAKTLNLDFNLRFSRLVISGGAMLGHKISDKINEIRSGKTVDVEVKVEVKDNHGVGEIQIDTIIPKDMQDNQGNNAVFQNFAAQTGNVYMAIIEDDNLVYNGSKVTAKSVNGKIQLTYNNQRMTQNEVNDFMKVNAQHFSDRLQKIYNKHVKLEVDAPRPGM